RSDRRDAAAISCRRKRQHQVLSPRSEATLGGPAAALGRRGGRERQRARGSTWPRGPNARLMSSRVGTSPHVCPPGAKRRWGDRRPLWAAEGGASVSELVVVPGRAGRTRD